MTTRVRSESYPFLAIAKHYNVNYGWVLLYADDLESTIGSPIRHHSVGLGRSLNGEELENLLYEIDAAMRFTGRPYHQRLWLTLFS